MRQVSRTTWSAFLSGRKPRHAGCRSRPSRVHSVNRTSPTSSGLTHRAPRASALERRSPKWGTARGQRFQSALQVLQRGGGEPGAHLAGVAQPVCGRDGEQQRPDAVGPPSLPGPPSGDQNLLGAQVLDLQPASRARPGLVGRLEPAWRPRPPGVARERRPVRPGRRRTRQEGSARKDRTGQGPPAGRGAPGRAPTWSSGRRGGARRRRSRSPGPTRSGVGCVPHPRRASAAAAARSWAARLGSSATSSPSSTAWVAPIDSAIARSSG